MAGKIYVTRGYSTYTNIPACRGGYDHGPNSPGNEYMVETNTIEKVHAPAARFKEFDGSPSRVELLKDYVHSPTRLSSPKYAPINHFDGHGPNYGLNYENVSPPKYQPQSTIDEAHNANLFARPSHDHPSGTNKSWLSVGPPTTHHPLTNPTNNIDEALGLLEESVYHSRADPRRRGVLDDSTRAQPLEPHSRYANPVFNDVRYNINNTGSAIDSHEAVRRYRGSLVP
ncbi:hypothetical protein CTI12_AA162850 [Artemisia annua]|uniref:Uncharacterized protein n=1 Tax=Artemisia annua TaxID=35608 RepID=A0A2U1PE39_ARTAN|nr:hypothetical protein CTI12_AA162850 [Artemisia annua]